MSTPKKRRRRVVWGWFYMGSLIEARQQKYRPLPRTFVDDDGCQQDAAGEWIKFIESPERRRRR